MDIISVGYNFRHDKNFQISRPIGLNYYLFLFIRSGAYYYNNNEKIHIAPNSIILFDKNTPQLFGAINDSYTNDWVAFSLNKDEEALFSASKILKDKFIPVPTPDFFKRLLHLMNNEYLLSEDSQSPILNSLLKALSIKYKEITASDKSDLPYYNELLNLRSTVYKHPTDEYTIESFAEKLHLSKSYFSHLYKKYFNTTPINDVINSKISYAKQLLRSTGYSVSEISQMLNYPCDTQFMKQFKKLTQTTPSSYRKSLTNTKKL